MGEGRPCGLWRCVVNLGVTTPQLLRARWGPLQTTQRSGGPRARGKGLPHPACLSGPLGKPPGRPPRESQAGRGRPRRVSQHGPVSASSLRAAPRLGSWPGRPGRTVPGGCTPASTPSSGPPRCAGCRHPWLGEASSSHSHLQGIACPRQAPQGQGRTPEHTQSSPAASHPHSSSHRRQAEPLPQEPDVWHQHRSLPDSRPHGPPRAPSLGSKSLRSPPPESP